MRMYVSMPTLAEMHPQDLYPKAVLPQAARSLLIHLHLRFIIITSLA